MSRPWAFPLMFFCMLCMQFDRAPAAPTGRYSAQLALESDALIRVAIRRPYGWAWDRDAAGEPNNHPLPHAVSMESLGTPAAGLVLLWTGKLLNEPRYLNAAEEAARGVAAAQMPIGRIRSHPVFGPAAGGREEVVPVANRTATRCALGLLLATIDNTESTTAPADNPTSTPMAQSTDSHAEALRSAAARCTYWLAKQEAPNGFWPSWFSTGAGSGKAIRLIRLDDADYRDSTFALLLSFDLLHDDVLRPLSTRPLAALLKLRLMNDVHGPGLWCTACTVDGTDIPTGFPNGPDVLASRYAVQTLLGGYLFTGDHTLATALDQAATTLEQARRADGLYDRFLDPTAAADVARSLGEDVLTTQQFFAHPTTKPQDGHSVLTQPSTSGSFDVAEVLGAASFLKSSGPDGYIASMAPGVSLRQQIEACLCGVIDDPLTMDFPVKSQEIPGYLSAHADLWKLGDGPAPDDLSGRVKRLWVLLLRAKLERLAETQRS